MMAAPPKAFQQSCIVTCVVHRASSDSEHINVLFYRTRKTGLPSITYSMPAVEISGVVPIPRHHFETPDELNIGDTVDVYFTTYQGEDISDNYEKILYTMEHQYLSYHKVVKT